MEDEKDIRFNAAIQAAIQQRDAHANQAIQLQMDNAILRAQLQENQETTQLPLEGNKGVKEKAAN